MYIMKKERKNYFDPMTHRVQLLRSMLQCTLACLCAQHALQRDTLACSCAQCALQCAMLLHTTVHAKKLVPQRVGVSIGSHRLGSRIKEERRNRHKVMWTFLKVGQWYMLGWLAWVRKKRENIAASRIEDKETKQKAMKVVKKS